MPGPCTICFTKKERDLRGLLDQLKESGASVSAYCSLALQYFMEYNKYLCIGTVVPAEDDERCFVSLYLDEDISAMLTKYMERYHIKNRSKLIKTVLSMSVKLGSEREAKIIPEFELRRFIYDNVPLAAIEPEQPRRVVEPTSVIKEQKSERVVEPAISFSHLESMEDEPEEVEEEQDLLDNLFSNIGAQMNKW